MRTQSRDTRPEAERVLIELIRKAPIAKRFGLVRSMTAAFIKMSVRTYRQQNPQATWSDVVQIIRPHRHQFNLQLLDACLQNKSSKVPFEPDILRALISITAIFEKLNISYYIGGSLASAAYGMQQLAQDIDFVIELLPTQIPQLMTLLQPHYYVDEREIVAAVQEDALLVIDVFVPSLTLFEKQITSICWRRVFRSIHGRAYKSRPCNPPDIISSR